MLVEARGGVKGTLIWGEKDRHIARSLPGSARSSFWYEQYENKRDKRKL